MANPYVVVDHILKDENQGIAGTYNISFTELDSGDRDAIGQWVKDTLSYNEINDAPKLPEDTNDESNSYETINDERKIKSLKEVAFTGSYDSLVDAPEIPNVNGERPTQFNQVAFTGQLDVNSAKVSKVINLSNVSLGTLNQFSGWTQEELDEENIKLQYFGNSDSYVRGFNKANISLTNELNSAVMAFNNSKIPTFFVTRSGTFFVLNVHTEYDGPLVVYYRFDLAPIYDVSYERINYNNNGAGATAEEAENELDKISIDKNKAQIWVFDLNSQVAYCKISFGSSGFTGNYNDLIGAPAIPSTISAQDREVFNPVAFIGVKDLDINPLISNILDLSSYTGTLLNSTSQENTENNNKLQALGNDNSYILGLTTFINLDSNNSLINDLSIFISNFINYRKPSYIISSINTFSVIDMKFSNENNDYIGYEIKLNNQINSNYNSIRANYDNITKEQAKNTLDKLNINSKTSVLIIDITNNLIYFKKEETEDRYIINFGDFIYNYNSSTGEYTQIESTSDKNILQNCGSMTNYIKNIDQLYSNTGIALVNELKNNLLTKFQNGKKCFLYADNAQYAINNITNIRKNNNNEIFNFTIESEIITNTFNTQSLYNSNETNQYILNHMYFNIYKSIIVIDLQNNILYTKVQKIFPLDSYDNSIISTEVGTIGVAISEKNNNKLEIITETNQQGLYVN